jgi:Asp-tRNA(Asn)/Glu-tRNA(Gln) amidotransferase A subunit family amidase
MIPTKLTSYIHQQQAFLRHADTPTAFLHRCLEVIDQREGHIHAFVALDREGAELAAVASSARWKSGSPLSPVDGMPVGIKDVIETANMPTGQGSAQFSGTRTGRDAAAVLALREAGAIILGKTVTTEFAATHPGETRNPCDLERTPGGSSSGSAAAVSAGMLPAALGTQVVGSIIRPASYCGVYGYKPSFGSLNRGGSNDQLSQSCLGVLGASLDDICAVAAEIALRVGGDPGYPALHLTKEANVRPTTLAVLNFAAPADVGHAERAAFAVLCKRLQDCGLRVIDRDSAPDLERLEQALLNVFTETRRIVTWESVWPLREYAGSPNPRLSADTLARVQEGRSMTPADYVAALTQRNSVRTLSNEVLGAYDAVISLAATGVAPIGITSTGNPRQNVAASYLSAPVVSLPVMHVDGLPLGLQVMACPGNDSALFNIAYYLESLLKT